MPSSQILLPLAKVIIAAAWADGDVSPEEINCMKDLFFGRLELTVQDWARLDMYIEAPVGEAERGRLVEELNAYLRGSSDRAAAIEALNSLVEADGVVSERERGVVDEIISDIESGSSGVFGRLGSAFRGSVRRQSEALVDAPNREEHFEDFIKNKVYYGVQRRLDLGESELDLPEEEMRKLSLAGGLMARIAQADREVSDGELEVMVEVLIRKWNLSQEEASFVTQVAISEVGPSMEYFRMARQFFDVTTETERKRFLEVLFAIAAADGKVANLEHEEIRSMTTVLKLTHKDFIDAKLKATTEKSEAE